MERTIVCRMVCLRLKEKSMKRSWSTTQVKPSVQILTYFTRRRKHCSSRDRPEIRSLATAIALLFVAPLLRRKPTAKVVDFGCGGGHQTLPLAYHFPDATFVLVDAKARSLEVAERRAAAATP